MVKLIVKPRNSGGHGFGGQSFLSDASGICVGSRGTAGVADAMCALRAVWYEKCVAVSVQKATTLPCNVR